MSIKIEGSFCYYVFYKKNNNTVLVRLLIYNNLTDCSMSDIIVCTFSKHPVSITSIYTQHCPEQMGRKVETYLLENCHLWKIDKYGCCKLKKFTHYFCLLFCLQCELLWISTNLGVSLVASSISSTGFSPYEDIFHIFQFTNCFFVVFSWTPESKSLHKIVGLLYQC